eukprot:COSAG06_NODE_18865_length_864_cov_1.623529_2_plen_75_part_01
MRASSLQDITVLSAGGYADAASQDAFCKGTHCNVTVIYDQSPNGNDLGVYFRKSSSRDGAADAADAAWSPSHLDY